VDVHAVQEVSFTVRASEITRRQCCDSRSQATETRSNTTDSHVLIQKAPREFRGGGVTGCELR